MERKEKYIKLDSAKILEIAKIKKVSPRSVHSALSFQTNSPLAMLIRAWALNNGGKLFVQAPIKNQCKS